MIGKISSVPFSFIIVFLVEATGIVLIEANNVGLEFIIFASAYVFCITGLYVIYRVLVNMRSW